MPHETTYFAPEGGFKIGDRFFQAGEIIPPEHFNAAPLHVQNALRLAGGAAKLKGMAKQPGLFGGTFLPTQEAAALKAPPKPAVHPEEKQGELFDDLHAPAHMPLFDQPKEGRSSASKEPWQMTYEELRGSLSPANKDELENIRPLLSSLYPPTDSRISANEKDDPWGIYRAIQKGDSIPRVPVHDLSIRHREHISNALQSGKSVPDHVLADYPDLSPQIKPHQAEPANTPPPSGPPVQKTLFSVEGSLKQSGEQLKLMFDPPEAPKETSPAPEPAATAPSPAPAPASAPPKVSSPKEQTQWHPLVEQHNRFLYGVAKSLGHKNNSLNQEDAVHEGRVAMQQAIDKNPNIEIPLLLTAGRRGMIDHYRSIQKSRNKSGPIIVQASQVEPADLSRGVANASIPKASDITPTRDDFLQHLPDPIHQQIIGLQLDGHDIHTIASKLGMHPKQVYKQRLAAIARMKEGMKAPRTTYSVSPDERYGIWSNMKAFGGKVMDKVAGAAEGLGYGVNEVQAGYEQLNKHPVAQKIDRGIDAMAGKVRGLFGGRPATQTAPSVRQAAKIPNPAQVVRDQGVNSAFTASAKVPDQARRQMRESREGLVNPIGAQPGTGGPSPQRQPSAQTGGQSAQTTGHEKLVTGPRTFQVHMREPISAHHDQFVGEGHGDFVVSKTSGNFYLRYNGHLYPVTHQEAAVNFVDGKMRNSNAIRSRIHGEHQEAQAYPSDQVPKGVRPTPQPASAAPSPGQSPAPAAPPVAAQLVRPPVNQVVMTGPPPGPHDFQAKEDRRADRAWAQAAQPPAQPGPPPVQPPPVQPPPVQPPPVQQQPAPSVLDKKAPGSLFTGRELGMAHVPRDMAAEANQPPIQQSSASGPPASPQAAPGPAASGPGFGQQLRRNLKMGMNNVSIQFENEKHRDLFDWYANWKFRPSGKVGGRQNRPDNREYLAKKYGIPLENFLVEAAKVHDATKAQIKGIKDGEHRDLKMSPMGDKIQPPEPPAPIEIPLDGGVVHKLDMTNPLNHALVRVHGFHPGRVLMMSEDQKKRMLQTIGENAEIQATAPPPSPARQQAMEKQAAQGNSGAQRALDQLHGGQPATNPQATVQTQLYLPSDVRSGQRPWSRTDQAIGPGWKLHLTSNNPEEVAKHLDQMGVVYKIGKSGQVGKDLTVYIGHRDLAEKYAKQIKDQAGHLLTQNAIQGNRAFNDVVSGRFDANTDTAFHQYGEREGVPWLKDDMEKVAMRNMVPLPGNHSDQAHSRALQAISRKYADMFHGSQGVQQSGDQLPGGRGDNIPQSSHNPQALAQGAKVEAEHTSNPAMAQEIASDHLTEDPKYYDKLAEMEGKSTAAVAPKPTAPQSIGNTVDEWSDKEKAIIDAVHKWRPKETSPAPEPAKSGPHDGTPTKIKVAGWSEPVSAKYAVMELKDVQASHDYWSGGSKNNPNYPANLQPRDYSRKSPNDYKVHTHAQEKIPGYYNADHPDALSGAPTLSAEGHVINGNGRVHALQLAAGKGDYDWLKNDLVNKAQMFGLDANAIRGMQHPVLVRKTDIPSSSSLANRFARDGNIDMTYKDDPIMLGDSLSHLVDDELLNEMNMDPDETLSDLWSRANSPIVQQVRESIPASWRSQYFTDTGKPNSNGKEILSSMLLSKVLPGKLRKNIAADQASLMRAIEGTIPQILTLQKHFNIGRAITDAIAFMSKHPEIYNKGLLDESQRQLGLFEDLGKELQPHARMMAEYLLRHRGKTGYSVSHLRKSLGGLVDMINQRGGLFTSDRPEHEEAAEILGVTPREGATFRHSALFDLLIERFNASGANIDKSRGSDTVQKSPRTPTASPIVKLRYSNGIRPTRYVVSR